MADDGQTRKMKFRVKEKLTLTLNLIKASYNASQRLRGGKRFVLVCDQSDPTHSSRQVRSNKDEAAAYLR